MMVVDCYALTITTFGQKGARNAPGKQNKGGANRLRLVQSAVHFFQLRRHSRCTSPRRTGSRNNCFHVPPPAGWASP